ncbi:hypothetical protein Cni_G08229 [Canna indica]|uniref:Protein BZR1 homolog n=1 Tax=Canna indica TaxID=4628 RepID=A0AAQ3Q873_9LILI|nr:hypothetical protein Cni_G08229 [Canna indica]
MRGGGSGGGNREEKTEKEKEKTRLRERKRRSITSNIFKGLRKHGGYNLPARADINDVLRALAGEAGWVVEPDGTTYRATEKVTLPSSNTGERSGTGTRFATCRLLGGGGNGGGESSVAAALRGSPQPAPARGLVLSPLRSHGSFGGAVHFEDLCVGVAVDAWPPEEWTWGQTSQFGASQQNV